MRGAAAIQPGALHANCLVLDAQLRGQFVSRTMASRQVAKFLHSRMGKNDVIVTGWTVGFTLEQFFDRPERCIMLPEQLRSQIR